VERLDQRGETSATRQRHATFFLALADYAPRPWAISGFRFDRIERFEREHDDLRAALDWLTADGRVREALLPSASLAWAWSVRGYGGEMLDRLIGLLDGARTAATHERAVALRAAGRLAWEQGAVALLGRHRTWSGDCWMGGLIPCVVRLAQQPLAPRGRKAERLRLRQSSGRSTWPTRELLPANLHADPG
jgi:hypothetical protein